MSVIDQPARLRAESMHIAGKHVDADGVIDVHYPYTGEVIGTVPAGRAEHARRAFAASWRSSMTARSFPATSRHTARRARYTPCANP